MSSARKVLDAFFDFVPIATRSRSGHLFGPPRLNLTDSKNIISPEIWITAARAGCESGISPEGRIGAHCFSIPLCSKKRSCDLSRLTSSCSRMT